MKRLIFSKKEICTIPNYLTFLRIALVPVFMTLLILGANAKNMVMVYCSLGVMLFAQLTDVFDGKIARRFNQGSYIGQCIDPIADKVMHIGALIALSICGYLHWAFIIVLAVRESMMIIVGSFIVNKVNIKADMLGKVASATISIGVLACFFHPYISTLWGNYGLDWIVVTIGLCLNWAAAINYAVGVFKQLKADKAEKAEGANTENAENTKDAPVTEETKQEAASDAVDNN